VGLIFFPDKSPQVRSIKGSALSHIKSADQVKNGTHGKMDFLFSYFFLGPHNFLSPSYIWENLWTFSTFDTGTQFFPNKKTNGLKTEITPI
jgi:hypothetical protein